MQPYLINGGIILTFNPELPLLEDYSLLVNDGKINQILKDTEIESLPYERLDAQGKIIMPGLINAHHHFYSTLVTGLTKATPAKDFLGVLENLWWRLDKQLTAEDIYISALISAMNAIRKGCTTIFDHHSSPGTIKGSLSQIAKAIQESGIRASLCYEVSDRDGIDKCEEGILENVTWLQQVSQEQNPRLKGLFGMHAAFTLSDDSLQEIADWVDKLNCGIHIHIAEGEYDELFNIQHYGQRVIERLCDFDLLNCHSLLAHGVHLNAREMMLIEEAGAAVITNPQSNLNNAVGIADVCKMDELGITVGLGTDAMTTNMLEELRIGIWAQHLKQNNPSAGFKEMTKTLLFNNPLIAQKYWGEYFGTIAEGAPADIILIDYEPPTPLNEENWIGHIVNGISQANVNTTICAGEILMWNGQLMLPVDENEVRKRGCELASALWERF